MKKCGNFAWCKTYLTGRQRKWCSDKCRKQAKRRHEKSVRVQRQMSAFRPLSLGRLVEMRLIVDSNGQYPYLYKNANTLKLAIQSVCMSDKMRLLVLEELEKQIPGYEFKVIIQYPR